MSVDTLGANCDQRLSIVQCRFTSTETTRLIRDRETQDGHLDFPFTQLPTSVFIMSEGADGQSVPFNLKRFHRAPDYNIVASSDPEHFSSALSRPAGSP